MKKKFMKEAGNALQVQKHQRDREDQLIGGLDDGLAQLSDTNDDNIVELVNLLNETNPSSQDQGSYDPDNAIGEKLLEAFEWDEVFNLLEEAEASTERREFGSVDTVDVDVNDSWTNYMDSVESYALENKLDLSEDPFKELLSNDDQESVANRIETDYVMKKAHCDKYDYLIAAFCGVATGLIDVFFVGMPGNSKLGAWTDKQADNLVMQFAKLVYNADKKSGKTSQKKEPDSISSAIGYLERRFSVNYDARYPSDLGLDSDKLDMAPSNHHMKSIGHAPDLIGLFFSVLDQFTGTSSFISNGRIVRVNDNKDFELQGNSFVQKIFYGIFNWLGHLMSDMAGSSGVRGHRDGRRGSGIPIPFFEMLQLCNFGNFHADNGEKMNFADLTTKMFERGYDARHGAACAIPVVINELMIRLIWTLKGRFYHQRSWQESVPFGDKPELRRMLTVGHGCLCAVDATDAAIRSKGSVLTFASHLNLVGWSRFAFSALQEIRAVYIKDSLNVEAMEKDLKAEWNCLFKEM